MRKQKNYLKDHLQKFASRAHHQLRHHVGVTPTSDSQNSLSTSELPNTKALINSSYSETSISVAVKENDEYKRPRQRHRNENDNSKARKGAVKWKFDIDEQKKNPCLSDEDEKKAITYTNSIHRGLYIYSKELR